MACINTNTKEVYVHFTWVPCKSTKDKYTTDSNTDTGTDHDEDYIGKKDGPKIVLAMASFSWHCQKVAALFASKGLYS